jgi:hypothetical protein
MRFQAAADARVLAETIQRGRSGSLGPAVIERTHGAGKVIYIGSGLEAIYEETRMAPVRAFLGRLIGPSLHSFRTYEIEYRPGLTPLLAASADSLVLHLIADIGNKERHFRARESYSRLQNLNVRLRIPEGRGVRRVSLLRSGRALPWKSQSGWVTAQVPEVTIYDAVHVELV